MFKGAKCMTFRKQYQELTIELLHIIDSTILYHIIFRMKIDEWTSECEKIFLKLQIGKIKNLKLFCFMTKYTIFHHKFLLR